MSLPSRALARNTAATAPPYVANAPRRPASHRCLTHSGTARCRNTQPPPGASVDPAAMRPALGLRERIDCPTVSLSWMQSVTVCTAGASMAAAISSADWQRNSSEEIWSRSDLMNLAVGFNPRWAFRQDAPSRVATSDPPSASRLSFSRRYATCSDHRHRRPWVETPRQRSLAATRQSPRTREVISARVPTPYSFNGVPEVGLGRDFQI